MIDAFEFNKEDLQFILRCCFVVFEQGLLPECRDKKVLLHELMSIYVDITKNEKDDEFLDVSFRGDEKVSSC